jgi:hypothetical protein
MAAELRWILLALSLVLLAGIWWWGRRRSSQAPGDAQLRELTPTMEPQRHEAPLHEPREESDWGVPPLEPLSIRTQDFERVPVLDTPMMVHFEPTIQLEPAAPVAAPAEPATMTPASSAAISAAPAVTPGRVPTLQPTERSGTLHAQTPNAAEQQKIVTLRVCAAGEARCSRLWSCTASPTDATRCFIAGMWMDEACFAWRA